MKDEALEASLEPADPDSSVHAAWITHVRQASDTSLNQQVAEQQGHQGSVGVGTSSLTVPERLEEKDVSQPRHWLFGRGRGAVTMVSIALALAAVGIASQHFGLFRNSQEPSDHTAEALSSPEGLSTGNAATGTELGSPKLMVQTSPAVAGEPAPLGLALSGAANGAVVLLRGLPPGMELSAGRAVSDGVWQLSAADLSDVWIGPPAGFVGSTHLVAELQLPNSQIVDRQSIHLEWTQGGHEASPTTTAPAVLQLPNDPPVPKARAEISAKPSEVEPSSPRELNRRARQGGDNDLRRSDRGRRAPSIGDSSGPPKGFWDWSR